ncbi:MAG: leucyl aminopeptidase [Pseudohongiellaceae bacterium]
MKYSINSNAAEKIITDCLVIPVWNKAILDDSASSADRASGKAITRILRAGDLNGNIGDSLLVHSIKGLRAKRVLLLGCGERNKLDGRNFRKLLQTGIKVLNNSSATTAHFLITTLEVNERDKYWPTSRLVQEIEDGLYQYDLTKSKKAKIPALKTISLSPAKSANRKQLTDAINLGKAIGKGLNIAKQLGNLPGNICTPTYLAKESVKLGKHYARITTQVLGERQMQRLGMGSLLSVSAGSAQEAKLIVMQYKGTVSQSKPYVLVGKGITFDTGGISLKPGLQMDEMKFDMCGAASVIGTLTAVAELKLPVNVVGIIASAENMPGSKATKPGDVVNSMSGKTIEILNTDAEGRLVLCDALTYAARFNPRTVIDIATLTGAAVATFGSVVSALLSNNQKLADALLKHGEDCLDPAWQLPLKDEYQSLLDSRFADIANIGGPRAGTITAACFLSRFAEKYHWAHLDIAGSAWNSGAEKAATGRPVPLLVEYLRHQSA